MLTLSSDFGSPYPAAMKGVVLQRTDARLVDVAHDLPRHDVRSTAFWLREVLPYFPPAVHLVVVDPGVGTERRAIAIRAGGHALIGPDNGVLRPVARELAAIGGDAGSEAFEIRGFDPASSTFHGRDVFAPAAAIVHERGIDAFHDDDHFVPIDDSVDLRFPDPTIEADTATGEVLAVDDFGNVITNLPGGVVGEFLGDPISVDGRAIPAVRTYAERERGEPLVTIGSHGNVELAVREGRGDDAFGVTVGDAVTLSW